MNFNTKKLVVVRHEHFGYLIWSKELDKYLIPISKEVETTIRDIINGKTKIDLLNYGLKKELDKIGFNGTIKQVNLPLERRISAPLDCYFDYTSVCNLRCSYCYDRNSDDSTMTNEQIEQVLHELAKNGIMSIHLAGGEPISFPKRLEIYLKMAKKLGIGSSINSNGTLLKKEKLLEMIFENEPVTLTFSVDGHNKPENDKFRGIGTFEKVTSAIKLAVSYKRQVKSNIRIQVKAVWMPFTSKKQFEELVLYAIKNGADVMQFHNPERCVFHDKGFYANDIDKYYQNALFIGELKEKYSSEIQIWNIWNPIVGCGDIGLPDMNGCIGGQELIAIKPNGDLLPCLMNTYCFGNLFSDWSGDLRKFWLKSKKLSQFESAIQKVDDNCNSSCNFFTKCRGGSKTRVIVQNKLFSNQEIELSHLVGKDPLCPKEYVERNSKLNNPVEDTCIQKMQYFKSIAVTHSL